MNSAEINRLEPAQESGRFAPVADFHELHVGENFGAPPITREEEYRQHATDA